MDELKKLYDVLTREGKYTKSFEEFQTKWGDPSYKDKVYEVVSRDGLYTKDKNEFLTKYSGMGTSVAEQPIVEPMAKPVAEPIVEPLKKKELAQVPMEPIVSGTTELPSESTSLVSPKPFDKKALLSKGLEEATIAAPLENAPIRQQKVLTDADRLDVSGKYKKLNESLSSIDDKLINSNEEYVVPELNYKFGDLGFTFEESGATGDYMKVISPNGKEIEVSLDPTSNTTAKGEAKKLRQFINTNTPQAGLSKIEKDFKEGNMKFNSQKDIDSSIKSISDEANNLNTSLKTFLSEKQKLDVLPEGSKEFVDLQAKLIADRESILSKQELLQSRQKGLEKAVGKYSDMKAEQGTIAGWTVNTFLSGASSIAAGMSNIVIDIMAEVLPVGMGLNQKDADSLILEWAKKTGTKLPSRGLSSEEARNELGKEKIEDLKNYIQDASKKIIKKDVIPSLRKGNVELFGDAGTTAQFAALREEGFWGGAYAGLVRSLPAMIGGAGPIGWAQRTSQFYAQTSDAVMQEMEKNPEFDKISENEKLAVVLPIGVVGAVLEEFGLRNLKASQSIINKLTLSILGKAGMKIGAKSFRELVENEVSSKIARGLLTVSAAGLAEAETGAAQQAAEYVVKDIYNTVKDKQLFKTPETANEWISDVVKAGAQEAVGGFVLGVPTAVSVAYSGKGFLKMDNASFALFEAAANDENIQKAFVTSLKTKITQGDLTTEEAKEQLNNYRNSIGLFRSLPEGLDMKQKKEAMNLLKEKRDLENQIDGKDASLVKKQKERILAIDSELTALSEADVEVGPEQEEEIVPEVKGVLSTSESTTTALEALPTEEKENATFTDNEGSVLPVAGNEKKLADLFQEAYLVPEEDRTESQQSAIDAVEVSLKTPLDLESEVARLEKEFGVTEEVVSEAEDTINKLDDNEEITTTVSSLEEVPEQFRDRVTTSKAEGLTTRKSFFGIPYGKQIKVDGKETYTYTATGQELKNSFKSVKQNIPVPATTDTGVSVTNKSSLETIKAGLTDAMKIKVVNSAEKAVKTLKSIFPNFDMVVHTDEGSYNAAVQKEQGQTGTSGNFSVRRNSQGKIVGGRIDINLSKATTTTVAHEVAHSVLLKTFGDNPKLFKEFRDSISKVLKGDTNKALTDFANQYDEEVSHEEYLVQLTALIEQEKENISPTTYQKIAALINKFVSNITAGKIKVFEDIKNTKDLIDFLNITASSIRGGEEISVSGITAEINPNATPNETEVDISSITSKSSLIQDLGLERFPQMKNRIQTGFELSQLGNITSHLTFSDRLVTGKVDGKDYLGGILFAAATGRVWASFGLAKVNAIIKGMTMNKDGYRYLMPAILTEEAHMSNNNMLIISLKLVEDAIISKSISTEDANKRIQKALSKKDLKDIGDKYAEIIKDKEITPQLLKEAIETIILNEGSSTFDQRKSFLETLLGKADIDKSLRFGDLPSFSKLAKGLAEPITNGHKFGDIILAIRTKGNLVAVKPEKTDADYHPSYPWVIRSLNPDGSISDVETLVFKKSYNAVNVFPEVTNSKGVKLSYEQYKEKYKEGAKSRYLNYMGASSAMSTNVSEPINVKAQEEKEINKIKTNDKENITGLPSNVREGQKPKQAKPIKSAGKEKIITGRDVQAYEEEVSKPISKSQMIDNELSKNSGTTQREITTASYIKAANTLKELGVKGNVLDYGAGLGLGTDAMNNVLNGAVKSYEINPENWKGKEGVTFTKSEDIKGKYDGIVSLNVINVVPKNVRDFIIEDIFKHLNDGGTAIISSRKFKDDISRSKNFILGAEPKSYIVKLKKDGKTIDVYQKGFDNDELVDYVKDLLGDKAIVTKKNNTYGASGVVIRKTSGVSLGTPISKSQIVSEVNELEESFPVSKSQIDSPNAINKIIKDARGQGFSEQSIKIFLESKGLTIEEVTEAMAAETAASKRIVLSEETMPGYDRMMNQVDGIIEKSNTRGVDKVKTLQNVIDYVQGSKVYENATDVQREKLIRDIRKMFGKSEKSAPKAETILGTISDVNKITMSEKDLLVKQIKDYGKGAKNTKAAWVKASTELSKNIKELIGTGKITVKQAANVIRRFSAVNVFSEKSIGKFVDYMTKVFADAEYSNQLSIANKNKKAISVLSKNKEKNANLRQLGNQFSELDPSLVEDIYTYNKNAEQLKEALQGSRMISGGVKFAQTVDIDSVSKYVKDGIELQNKILLDEKIAEIQDLMGIDASDFTEAEIKALLQEDKEIKKSDEVAIKDTIKKMFNIYSTLIKETISSGVDPFTGEPKVFTAQQKDIVNRFMDMDLNLLSAKQSLDAVDSLINFFQNNSTAKMETVISEYTGRLNARMLVEKGIRSIKLSKWFSESFGESLASQTYNLNILFERMFKGVNRGAYVEKMSGITNLINKKAYAQAQSNGITSEYVSTFYKQKPNGEIFNTSANNAERGISAFMQRNVIGTQEEIAEDFKRRKDLVEKTIEELSKGNDKEKIKSEIYAKAYEKFKNAENVQDVIDATDKINLQAIQFWQNKWLENYDKLADVSLNVYNKILEKDTNYTPDKFTRLNLDIQDINPIPNNESSFHVNNGTLYKRETGVLQKAIKPSAKTTKNVMDFSFDKNNSNSMYDALIDINTAAPIRQIDAFKKSDDFKKVFNADDAKILDSRINTYVANIRQKSPYSNDELDKLVRSLNKIAAFGVGQALGGPTQALKQTIPVMLNTLVNAGAFDLNSSLQPDFLNFLKNSGYAIAVRGIESQADIDSLNKLIEKDSNNIARKGVDLIVKANDWWLNTFLVRPDVFVARASWKSYYEKDLKKQGINPNTIDYSNHKINEDAANYAQKMVDRQQNISDSDLAGTLFTDKKGATKILLKIFMPFASFRMNQAARLGSDLNVLTSATSTVEDKKIAAVSLTGFAVEMVAFKMLATAIAVYLGHFTKWLMDEEEDEEERTKRIDDVIKGQATSTVTDILSPVPVLDPFIQYGASYLTEQTQDLLDVEDEERVSLYEPKAKNIAEQFALFGIPFIRAQQLGQVAMLAYDGTFKDNYGREKQITEENQDALKKLLPIAIMSNIGLAPVEASTVVRNAIKYSKKTAFLTTVLASTGAM